MDLVEAFSDSERIFSASKTRADRGCMVQNGFIQRLVHIFNTVIPSMGAVATPAVTATDEASMGGDESSLPDLKLVLLLLKCLRNCVIECVDNANYIYSYDDGSNTIKDMFSKLNMVCKWILLNHYMDDAGEGSAYSDSTYNSTYSDIALVLNQFVANFTACGDDMKHFVWTNECCNDLFSNLIAVSVLTRNKKAFVASIAAIINSIKCNTTYYNSSSLGDGTTTKSFEMIDIFASQRSRPFLSQWLLSVMDLQRSKNDDDPDDVALLQWNHLLALLIVEKGAALRVIELMHLSYSDSSGVYGVTHEQVVFLRLLYDVADDTAAHGLLTASPDTPEVCRWLARAVTSVPVEDILDLDMKVTDKEGPRRSIPQQLLLESTPLLMQLLSTLLALLPSEARVAVSSSTHLVDRCLRMLVKRATDGSEQALGDKLEATRAIAASFDAEGTHSLQDTLRTAMQLLSNLIYRCEELQDELRTLGGLPVVLSRSSTDFANPLMREWALLCLRNACEGNFSNQRFIEELKLQSVVDRDNLLGKQGVQLSVDKETGKITVIKTEMSAAQPAGGNIM